MGNPFTEAVGNVLTKLMGNVLTEILGKVLDIYYPRHLSSPNFCPDGSPYPQKSPKKMSSNSFEPVRINLHIDGISKIIYVDRTRHTPDLIPLYVPFFL